MMKFFTPELYIRYNSADDAEADRADKDWEKAIRDYKDYLSKQSKDMNDRLKELAESLCLHDAEVLLIRQDVPRSDITKSCLSLATIVLRDSGNMTNLIYFLWSEIAQSPSEDEWPFSKLKTHWLYDELDVERDPQIVARDWLLNLLSDGSASVLLAKTPKLYWHRILLSDGRVISIPFFDVIIQSFSQQDPETTIIARK